VLLGRVVGRLWAARQASTLGGRKLLLVRVDGAGLGPAESVAGGAEPFEGSEVDRPSASSARDGDAPAPRRLIVAVDGLHAGPGDRVIVAHGSRVRDLTVGADVADKDVIVAIVDDLELAP
jgi:microcompartment protein CcmK/EutM